MPLPTAGRTLLVAVAVLLAGACGDDGRELAEPRPDQTTTTRPAPPTSAPPQQLGADGLTLESPEVEPGGVAPVDATCRGANRHPALSWTDVPEAAEELAITLSDQTDPANPVLLWLVAGIDPATTSLAAGEVPAGAVETANDYGEPGWGTPCLDTLGEGRRDLQFRLHALAEPSGLVAGQAGNEAWERVSVAAIDSASLLMTVTGGG